MDTIYSVTADIEYLDGGLTGLPIKEGFRLIHVTPDSANRTVEWINQCFAEKIKIKAVATRCRYLFKSQARLLILPA